MKRVELGNMIEKQFMVSFSVKKILASVLIMTFDLFFFELALKIFALYNKISRPICPGTLPTES